MPYKFNPFTGTFDDSTPGPAGVVAAANSGTALLPGITFASDPNTGIYNPGADQLAVATNGTGRLFIDASGNVLVNDSASITSNATGYVQIRQTNVGGETALTVINSSNSDSAATVKIKAGQATRNGGEIVFGKENASNWATSSLADGYIAFAPVLNNINTERLRITSAGLVGIGTSSPGATLEVAGSARFFGGSGTDGMLVIGSTGASNDAVIIKYDNANDRLQFYNWGASAPNQNTFVIDNANSRVGIGTSVARGLLTSQPSAGVTVTYDNTSGDAFFISNENITGGSGNFGGGITWGKPGSAGGARVASIASVQTTGDADQCGLAFFTKASASNAADLQESLRVTHDGKVGIGTASPSGKLTVDTVNAATNAILVGASAETGRTYGLGVNASAAFVIHEHTAASDRLVIDSSGRLLVGTSSAIAIGGESSPKLQLIDASATSAGWFNLARFANSAGANAIQFGKSRGTTVGDYTIVQNNDALGSITFAGSDGTDLGSYGAQIKAEVDGTPGANDMPGRIVLATTADGASSPTERMRITSGGEIQFGDSSTRNRAITSETDYYASGRNRLAQSWFVLRKGYKATGSSVAAEATITLSASAGSPEAFHKIRVIQSGALTRAYYEFLVSESSSTFSVVQDLSDYNKAQFTVSMSSPTLTITSGTAAVDFVYLQVEIETFAMGAAEPTISFATV